MKEIIIRDLKVEDLLGETGDGFYQTLFALTHKNIQLDLAQAQSIYYLRQYAGVRTLVATLDGAIIGTGSLVLEAKFIHDGGVVGHIEDVSVLEDYQYTGVGRKIVQELIEIGKLCKCYKLILDCSDKVLPFYDKLEFKKININNMRMDL